CIEQHSALTLHADAAITQHLPASQCVVQHSGPFAHMSPLGLHMGPPELLLAAVLLAAELLELPLLLAAVLLAALPLLVGLPLLLAVLLLLAAVLVLPLLLALPPAPELLEDALAPPEPALCEPLVDSEENRLLSLLPQPGPDARRTVRLDARRHPMLQRPAI